MADYILPDGRQFNIGDMITTYHKGYWELTFIEKGLRTDGSEWAMFHYKLLYDSKLVKPKVKAREERCSATCCQRFDKQRVAEMRREEMEWLDKLYLIAR